MIKVVLMIEIRKLFTLLIVATLECKTLTFFLINNLSKKKFTCTSTLMFTMKRIYNLRDLWCQLTNCMQWWWQKGGVGQWKSLFGALPRKTRFVKKPYICIYTARKYCIQWRIWWQYQMNIWNGNPILEMMVRYLTIH